MARHEDFRVCRLYLCQCLWRIVTRITADMGHQHINIFDTKEGKRLIGISSIATIDIAIYGTQWLELGNLIRQLYRADIAGVPNLIHIA